jgi:hypothetical protein
MSLREPSHVPTALPTVGSMDYPLSGYSRNLFVVRCVDYKSAVRGLTSGLTVARVSRSCEYFPDGFDRYLATGVSRS